MNYFAGAEASRRKLLKGLSKARVAAARGNAEPLFPRFKV
jgi:hypothetical protein